MKKTNTYTLRLSSEDIIKLLSDKGMDLPTDSQVYYSLKNKRQDIDQDNTVVVTWEVDEPTEIN